MDYLLAGVASVLASIFTNPYEVIKIRMQLQGELKTRGKHVVYYKSPFHAATQIVKHEGLMALQKGLVPALWVQFIMNSIRFGGVQQANESEIIRDKKGRLVFYKSVILTGCIGIVSQLIVNPFLLVKTRKQSSAAHEIAVGYQFERMAMFKMLRQIYQLAGVRGLFRGGASVVPRAFVISSTQLTGYVYAKEQVNQIEILKDYLFIKSSLIGMSTGIVMSIFSSPFDLVLTRLHNQGIGKDNKGIYYSGFFDCVYKIYKMEGILAFFKGARLFFSRIGPHMTLTIIFWDKLQHLKEKVIPPNKKQKKKWKFLIYK